MRKRKINVFTVLLLPFSLIYRFIIGIRNLMFDWEVLPSHEFNVPVITVGNITVGGTGKTPHTEYLVELLKDNFSVAILSRGYKRKTRNFRLAAKESIVKEIGDEPKQLKQKYPGIEVAVDRKRVNGIKTLLKLDKPLDVIILDDAFQHRYVNPGKSILLINYNRLITEDFLLPAGRLREPVSAVKRADIILITKSPERMKPIEMRYIYKSLNLDLHQHLFYTTIRYGELLPVFDNIPGKDESYFKRIKPPIVLMTGIANPRDLKKYARGISTKIRELTFQDHHYYTAKDLQSVEKMVSASGHPETMILTTEKDAMRLQDLDVNEDIRNRLYYVTIRVHILNNDKEEFNKLITEYVRSNKPNHSIHKKGDKA